MGPQRDEHVVVAATKSGKVGAVERLRPEQNSSSLLRGLVHRFSQSKDLVADLFAKAFLTAVACFTVPCHRVFVGCAANLKGFRKAREAVVRRSAKAALDDEVSPELSEEAAKAAVRVASLMPQAATADPRWSPPDELSLYQRMSTDVPSFLRSLCQDAKSTTLHRRRLVHVWSEFYESRMQKVDFVLLRIADA